MKAEDLLELIGDVSEEHVADAVAKNKKRTRFPVWAKWASAAAACLFVVIGSVALLGGGNTAEQEAPTESAGGGGSGHGEGMVFMSYAGPVFPLTLMEERSGIMAERTLSFDFSAYLPEAESADPWADNVGSVHTMDSYALSNHTEEDMIVEAVYPIAGDYQLMEWPAISVNGQEVAYEIVSGSYTGGFRGAGDEHTESVNLLSLTSWEGYRDLLSDGSYFVEAFADPPTLTTPMIVYEFTDITDGGCGHEAATLGVHYRYNSEATNIMTYGFNGGGEDPEAGEGLRDFFIREGRRREDENTKYMVVIGEDIWDIRMQGYENGSCEPEKATEGPAAAMTRSESTLGEVLERIARSKYDAISGNDFDGDHNRYLNGRIPFGMYYGDILKYYAEHGPMGAAPKERYSFEWGARIEDIIDETAHRERILYLTFPVTVPAGGSIAVEVRQHKESSFDFHCGGEDTGIEGYDMVTALGSNLRFTGQRASIENYGAIEIVRQNFGFDIEEGITEVELDLEEPHYYLEVRKTQSGE